jgi:YHS domain-containing protein
MAKDLICSADVDETKAGVTYDFKGQTYYFCASACKDQFVEFLGSGMNLSREEREGAPFLGDD